MAETIGRRAFPGEGEFDLDGYCTRMRAKGFDGVVSVEILNDEWRQGDIERIRPAGIHLERPVLARGAATGGGAGGLGAMTAG